MVFDRRASRRALGLPLLCAVLAVPALVAPAAAGDAEVPQVALREASTLPAFGDVLRLGDLVTAVLERSPTLVEKHAAARVAATRAERAAALDDPMATAMLAPLSLGNDVPFGFEVRATQRLPFPGKLRLRGDAASQQADAAAAEIEAARLALAATAVDLYADYYLNARELEINDEHLELLGTLKEVATARYAAGLVPQQAPVQAEVEAARMLHHGVELRAARQRLVARLDALLRLPADAPLPPPPATLPTRAAADHGAALALAIAERPELRALRAEVGALQARLELAHRGRLPDFEAMAGYSSMWDMQEHRFTVGVGVNLPLRGRVTAEVTVAEAELERATAALQRLTDELHAEAVSAAADREEAYHLVELYRDRVLPAARDQVRAAQASFETGGESMLGMLVAERSLRDAQLEHQRALAAALRADAALSRARGQSPLPEFAAAETPRQER
jgi:outer membrane protein TolC